VCVCVCVCVVWGGALLVLCDDWCSTSLFVNKFISRYVKSGSTEMSVRVGVLACALKALLARDDPLP
jgi:hypothetical protein